MDASTKSNASIGLVIIATLLLATGYVVVCEAFTGVEQVPCAAAGEKENKGFNNQADIGNLMTDKIRDLLVTIKGAERKGDFETALKCYQEVFDTAGDELVGPLAGSKHTYIEARRYYLERLDGLGEDKKALYRTLFEDDAEKLLNRAIDENDGDLLRDVVRRYMMTSSGAAALRRLGWQAYETGQYNGVIAYGRSMLRYHPSEVDPAMLAGLAVACEKTNSMEKLQKIAEVVGEKFPDAVILLRGKEVSLAQFVNDRMVSLRSAPLRRDRTCWTMPGGNDPRDRVVADRPGLRQRVWTYKFPKSIAGVQCYAAVQDGVVYVDNGEEVVALSLWNGGRIWRYKAAGVSEPGPGGIQIRAAGGSMPVVEVDVERPAAVTLGRDIVYSVHYGKLTAIRRDTGKKMWSARVAGEDTAAGALPVAFFFAVSPLSKSGSIYSAGVRRQVGLQTFVVYCHDAYSGKIKWRKELSSERIQLGVRGVVPGLGTNDLRFHTTPSFLCESDGTLYATTMGGSVAAIDAYSGEIIWLTLYDRGPGGNTVAVMKAGAKDGWDYSPSVVAGGRLVAAPMDSAYLHVFDAKTGKPLWHKPRRSKQGNFRHIVAVERNRRLIFVAGDNVVAYDLDSGTTRAEASPLEGTAVGPGFIYKNELYIPTDRGISVADIEASLKAGRVEVRQAVAWKDILTRDKLKDRSAVLKTAGNIVTAEGVLVVTSGSRVTALYDAPRRIAELTEAIRKGDDDGMLAFKRGLVYSSDAVDEKEKALSDYSAALEKLRLRAGSLENFREEEYIHYHGSPPTMLGHYGSLVMQARRGITTTAFEAAAALLGQDPENIRYGKLYTKAVDPTVDEKVLDNLETAREHAVDARSYVNCQLILLERAKKKGDWPDYFDLLVGMLHEWSEGTYDFSDYEPGLATREISVFCSEAIGETLKARGEQIHARYEKYRHKAARLLNTAKRRQDINGLLDVARCYPHTAAAGQALLAAMELAGRSGKHRLRACIALEYMGRIPDGADRFAAMAEYADALGVLGHVSTARRVLREMRSLALAARVEEFVLRGRRRNVSAYVKRKLAGFKGRRRYEFDIPFESARLEQVAQTVSRRYVDALLLKPTGLTPPGAEDRIYLLMPLAGRATVTLHLQCLDTNGLKEIWSSDLMEASLRGWRMLAWSFGGDMLSGRHALAYCGNSL
ncbi:MAG: hypothetical protein DRP79_07170, partial [Planctomycetota bacterium]